MSDPLDWLDGGAEGEAEGFGESGEVEAFETQRSARCDAVMFMIDTRPEMLVPYTTPDGAVTNAFESALDLITTFYKDKIITSEKDMVGVTLFGSNACANIYSYPNIFVFHEFDQPSAERITELQELASKVSPSNRSPAARKEFDKYIGSCATKNVFSDALWAVQHMFHHLKGPSSGTMFRRVFIFTYDEDPSGGSLVERDKSIARARDLKEGGVMFEIFACGNAVAPATVGASATGSGPGTGSVPTGTAPGTGSGGGTHSGPVPASVAVTGALPSGTIASATPTSGGGAGSGGAKAFDRRKFWDAILKPPERAGPDDYIGEVHVGRHAFTEISAGFKKKTFIQRAAGTLTGKMAPVPGAPTFSFSVFFPLRKAIKPRFVWFEGATNALLASETRLLAKDSGAEVLPTDITSTVRLGGQEIAFHPDEVKTMKSQFGGAGLTILGFKPREWLKVKFTVGTSAFVAPNDKVIDGSTAFMASLWRTLLKKKKIAIAEIIARDGASPRLAALVPSSDATMCEDTVTGGGFHLVYLPYADDYRSLQFEPFPKPEDAVVTSAKKVIRKLSVPYDLSAVPNPQLQQQYHVLQQVAVLSDDPPPVDFSLPDKEGMKKFAAAMHEFNVAAFPGGYDAERVADIRKAKPLPTKEEILTIDWERLESRKALDSLTVPYLKQYLKFHGETGTGVKADLIKQVQNVILGKRAGKRDRDGSEP